jgi:hypothetical protein
MPLSKDVSLKFVQSNGDLGEVDMIWATRSAWQRLPHSRSKGWELIELGPFLLAVKVMV